MSTEGPDGRASSPWRDRAAAGLLVLAVALEVGTVLSAGGMPGAAPAVRSALRWSTAVASLPLAVIAVAAASALMQGRALGRPLAAAAAAVGAVGLLRTGLALVLIPGPRPGADATFATATDLALLAGGAFAIAAWQDLGRPLPRWSGWRTAPVALGLLAVVGGALPATASSAGGVSGLRGAMWHTPWPWWVPTAVGLVGMLALVLAAARLAPPVVARAAAAAAAALALPPVLGVWSNFVLLDLGTAPTVWFLLETVGAVGLALLVISSGFDDPSDEPAGPGDQVSSAVA